MPHADRFPPPFRLGPWLVRPDLNRVEGPAGEVQIEPRVMQVLLALSERPGEVVTRLDLLDEVWGEAVVGEEILTRAVSELRRVFGDPPRQPRYIETIRNHGYRLVAAVEPAEAPAPPPPPVAPSVPPESPFPPPPVPPAPAVRVRVRLGFLAVGAILAVLLLGTAAVFGPRLLRRPPAPAALLADAVPLTSLPGRESQPALSADGTRVAFIWSGPDGRGSDLVIKQRNAETLLHLTEGAAWTAWPAWSPDGQSLAFIRGQGDLSEICTVSSLGGPVRPLAEVASWVEGLDWSPDGDRLVFAAAEPPSGAHRLFLLELSDLTIRPVAALLAASAGDFQPRWSPDGQRLAWVALEPGGGTGLRVAAAAGGPARTVLAGMASLQGAAWAADGRSLVVAAAPAGVFHLWRLPLSQRDAEPGTLSLIRTPGDFAWNPTVARATGELVYEEVRMDQDVWRIRVLGERPWTLQTEPFLRSTRWDYEAEYSPDGRKVVFVSLRSGAPEIWSCDADGGALQRLTDLRTAAVDNPRWSPDGRWIAFNVVRDGRTAVMRVAANGGRPSLLPPLGRDEIFTSWARDGRRLLVGADRGEGWQIYRRALDSVEAQRLTPDGGLTAQEGPGGRTLTFTRPDRPGLWRRDLTAPGAVDSLIIADLAAGDRRNWVLLDDRIAWVLRSGQTAFLMFHDLATGASEMVAELAGLAGPGLSLAPDRRTILFSRSREVTGDLMLVESLPQQAP